MVNTSLKNAFAKRNHKERGQLLHRQKLGQLEKHKDYVHRARDYKSKQDRIQKLREKAAFRNKDEFYWGMVKGQTQNGRAIGDRGNEALSTDIVKILKTQDAGYVRVVIAKDEKRIERLRRELESTAPKASEGEEWDAAAELAEVEKLAEMGVVLQAQEDNRTRKGKAKALPPSGHVIFVEGREEFDQFQESEEATASAEAVEEAVDLGWAEPTSSKRKIKATPTKPTVDDQDSDRTHRLDQLIELSALLSRVKQLRVAAHKLEVTKGMMGKGAARKVREAGFVEDENVPEDRNGDKKRWEGKMWKWKLERRR